MKENKPKKRLRQLCPSPPSAYFSVLTYSIVRQNVQQNDLVTSYTSEAQKSLTYLFIYLLDQRCPEDCFKMT